MCSIRKYLNFKYIVVIVFVLAIQYATVPSVSAHPDGLIFPVLGGGSFSNDFNDPRASGPHHATDIFAPKHTPILSPVDGTVGFVAYPQPSYGYYIQIRDADDFEYNFIHINNDTPGTDDGRGGAMNAYAPDMKSGNRVVKGQLIGYLGDSGNAESTAPHLHFEIYTPGGNAVNPYNYLRVAQRLTSSKLYPALSQEFLPYGNQTRNLLNISTGNIDESNDIETITAAGAGGSAHIKAFKGDSPTGLSFMAYSPSYPVGADVAVGDVDGDGVGEIITGAGPGGGPHVKVFKANGSQIASFYAYSPSFNGGIRVGAVDLDNDGSDEIVTGPYANGSPHIKVMKLDGTVLASFMAFSSSFTSGVDVSGGDLVGDDGEELVVSPGPGGSSQIRLFAMNQQGNLLNLGGFNAFPQGTTNGVRVSVNDVTNNGEAGKEELVTTLSYKGTPRLRLLSGTGSILEDYDRLFEVWWQGYNDAAGLDGEVILSTGQNRRPSVRSRSIN